MTSYGRNGKWRRSRTTHRCEMYWGPPIGRCATVITAGDHYYDTQELNGTAGGFGTDRICSACAEKLGFAKIGVQI